MLQMFVNFLFFNAEELGEIAGRVLSLLQQFGNSLAYCQRALLSKPTWGDFFATSKKASLRGCYLLILQGELSFIRHFSFMQFLPLSLP